MIDPAHLTDAELAAWYGSGLHAPKAQRLIEEVRRLRRELAAFTALFQQEDHEWFKERCELYSRAEAAEADFRDMNAAHTAAEARLAEVEAERDHQTMRGDEHFSSAVTFKERWTEALGLGEMWQVRAEAAEARLAAVEALRDRDNPYLGKQGWIPWEWIEDALRGEGDR